MDQIIEVYSELSTFELLELYYLAREAVGVDVTVFVTLVFGFLTVTYLVGSKLNRFEAISISVLYSFFLIFNVYAISKETGTIVIVSHLLYDAPLSASIRAGFVSMLTIVWLFSLFYLYQIKKK